MIKRILLVTTITVIIAVPPLIPQTPPASQCGTTDPNARETVAVSASAKGNVASGDELLDLPDNECDLLAYLTQLAQLRGGDATLTIDGFPAAVQGPVKPLPAPGRIQGTVVRKGTAEPISGVMISANSSSTITDSSGHFSIDNVPPGARAITAQLEGYFAKTQCGPFATMTSIQVIVVSQQTTNLTMDLIPGGAISGKVYDAVGAPQSDVTVQVYRSTYQNGSPYLEPTKNKTTDDHGEYRIYRLPPGDYYVAAIPRSQPGGRSNSTSSEIAVKTFYNDTPDPARSNPIAIKGGEEVTGTNISIQSEPGVTIAGQIVSALPALVQITGPGNQTREISNANSTLTISPHDKNSPTGFKDTINVLMTAPNLGRFEIRNAPPGTYDLLASLSDPAGFGPRNPPGKATGPMGFGRATVEVHGNNIRGIAINVHPGVDLKGRITVNGGSQSAQNVRISLRPDDSASANSVYQQVSRFQPVVDENGSFTIPSVPEGRYRFRVTYAIRDAYIEDIRLGTSSVYDNGLDVGAQSAGDIDVMIRTGTGSIQGTVFSVDRKPAAFTKIVLVPAVSRRQNLALYSSVLSDSNGIFNMNGIAPGNYELFSWQDFVSGAFQNTDYVQKYSGRGTIVSVPPSASVTADVQMIPAEIR